MNVCSRNMRVELLLLLCMTLVVCMYSSRIIAHEKGDTLNMKVINSEGKPKVSIEIGDMLFMADEVLALHETGESTTITTKGDMLSIGRGGFNAEVRSLSLPLYKGALRRD